MGISEHMPVGQQEGSLCVPLGPSASAFLAIRPLVCPLCAHGGSGLCPLGFVTNITSPRPQQLLSQSFPLWVTSHGLQSQPMQKHLLLPEDLCPASEEPQETGKFIRGHTRTEPEYWEHPNPMNGPWNPAHLVPQSFMNHLHKTKPHVLSDPTTRLLGHVNPAE